MTSDVTPVPARRPLLRRVFLGPVRLRAGWRFLLFTGLVFGLSALVRLGVHAAHVPNPPDWTPESFLFDELAGFAVTLLATRICGLVDRLPLAAFGLPLRSAFGRDFWEGSAWGFAAVAALVGAIALAGGYHVRGALFHGSELLRLTLLWLAAMVGVGLAEEAQFRGYPLRVLADGLGFWWGALLLSLLFAGLHYFLKPMEDWADALSVGLIGLFLCLTLRRTGALWFAIGFHFAFDFAALALVGAPNTGNNGRPIATRLLDGTFSGPAWLTGGPRGIEASWLVFPVIAALFLLFHLRHRTTRFPEGARRA